MLHATSAVDVLGGRKVLGQVATGTTELLDLVRGGLPYEALESVLEVLALPQGKAADLLHIPARTMARRKHEARLHATESDRLYRIARVVAHALDVFEDETAARHWLHTPSRVLGGETPLSLLDTDVGAARVEVELGRIEYGLGA